jgi:hypothetical protein
MMNCTVRKAKQLIVGRGGQKRYSSITAMMGQLQFQLMKVAHLLPMVGSDGELGMRKGKLKMGYQLLWCLLLHLRKLSFMW